MKKVVLKMVFGFALLAGTASAVAQPKGGKESQKPPTAEEMIKEMDANEDGKLAQDEVKGPLKDDFSKIDANEDGFLSLEELNKAPKPKGKKPAKKE